MAAADTASIESEPGSGMAVTLIASTYMCSPSTGAHPEGASRLFRKPMGVNELYDSLPGNCSFQVQLRIDQSALGGAIINRGQ